jgi:hypothetical protein
MTIIEILNKNNERKNDIIATFVTYIRKHFPNNFTNKFKQQKYPLVNIIDAFICILLNNISYSTSIINNIPGKTLNKHMIFFSKNNIFVNVYKILLKKYFKKNKCGKLKYQSIDSSYIYNKYSDKNIGRNKFYKSKNGKKISAIVDSNGIALSLIINSGNNSDSTFVDDNFKSLMIDPNTQKYTSNNRYKQYFLADSGYDSNKIRKLITEKGYKYICPQNKRNIQNPKKLITLTKKDKLTYKNRIIVENYFAWIKKNKRLDFIYDKLDCTLMSFIYLASIFILYKHIC